MPVVEISAGAWTNFANRLTNFTGISPVTGATVTPGFYSTTPLLAYSPTGNTLISVIRIYSGTRQSAWMGTTTSVDANKLVEWKTSTADYTSAVGPVTYTVTGTSPLTTTTQIITSLNAATASGTASWFLLGVVNNSTTTLYQQITGTVGVPGSGADLIMSTTTIVSGELYKVADLTLTFSSVFTYA